MARCEVVMVVSHFERCVFTFEFVAYCAVLSEAANLIVQRIVLGTYAIVVTKK